MQTDFSAIQAIAGNQSEVIPASTISHSIGVSAATAELCAIMSELLSARKHLDAFYGSEQGAIMREFQTDYLDVDQHLGAAFGALFDVVGYYIHGDFMGAKHEPDDRLDSIKRKINSDLLAERKAAL